MDGKRPGWAAFADEAVPVGWIDQHANWSPLASYGGPAAGP
jgi:hypothetical protein